MSDDDEPLPKFTGAFLDRLWPQIIGGECGTMPIRSDAVAPAEQEQEKV